jgi:hypothetical protein
MPTQSPSPSLTAGRQRKEKAQMIIRFIAEEAVTEPFGAVVNRVERLESIDGLRFLADTAFLGRLRPGDVVTIETASNRGVAPLQVSTQHTHSVASMKKWDKG